MSDDSDSETEIEYKTLSEFQSAFAKFNWDDLKKACELEPKCFDIIQQAYNIFKPKKLKRKREEDKIEFADLQIGSEIEIMNYDDSWSHATVIDIGMEDTRIYAYVELSSGISMKFTNRNMSLVRAVQKKQKSEVLTAIETS